MNDKLTAEQLNATLPYLFSGEIDWFHVVANNLVLKDGIIVILGAGPGLMSLSLVEANPDLWKRLVAVDHNESVAQTYKQHLIAAGFDLDEGPFISDTCDSFLLNEIDNFDPISLLVIDADHSYEAVKEDIKHWWPKLKYGGFIFFHDYIDLEQNGTNGVARAIDEMKTEEWEEIERPGISIVFKKVKRD